MGTFIRDRFRARYSQMRLEDVAMVSGTYGQTLCRKWIGHHQKGQPSSEYVTLEKSESKENKLVLKVKKSNHTIKEIGFPDSILNTNIQDGLYGPGSKLFEVRGEPRCKLSHNMYLIALVIPINCDYSDKEVTTMTTQALCIAFIDWTVQNVRSPEEIDANRDANVKAQTIYYSHTGGVTKIRLLEEKISAANWKDGEHYESVKVQQIVFSHNDEFLLVCSNYGFCLFSTKEKKIVFRFWKTSYQVGPGDFYDGRFCGDDRRLVIASNHFMTLQFFDSKILELCATMIPCPANSRLLKISPDDLVIVLGRGGGRMIFMSDSFTQTFLKKAYARNEGAPGSGKDLSYYLNMLAAYSLPLGIAHSLFKSSPSGALIFGLLAGSRDYWHKKLRETVAERNRILLQQKQIKGEIASSLLSLQDMLGRILHTVQLRNSVDLSEPLALDWKDDRAYTCLSIDGDGMQAVVAVAILAKLQETTGCYVHDLFDCITGSSFWCTFGAWFGCYQRRCFTPSNAYWQDYRFIDKRKQ